MRRAIPLLAVLILLSFFSFNSSAVSEPQFSRIFPAACPGVAKAAIAFAPKVHWTKTGIQLDFNLALKTCAEGSHQFEIYVPHQQEYVEVFDLAVGQPVTKLIPHYDSFSVYPMTDDELRTYIIGIYKTAGIDLSEVVKDMDRTTLEDALTAQVPSVNKTEGELSFSQVSLELPIHSLNLPTSHGEMNMRLDIWLFGARIPYNLLITYQPESVTADLLAY